MVSHPTLTDMQMPLVEKALRSYVKVIGAKAYLRLEKYITADKPVEEALDNTLSLIN